MKLPIYYSKASPLLRRKTRELYIKQQNGLCYYCKAPLLGEPAEEVRDKKIHRSLFPPNFFDWPIHLHHDHTTDLTIGAVHCYCNAVLWEYEEE